MFWLLACTPPPEPPPWLDVPVSPPKAIHATAVRTDVFVGPLDVADLDAAALCGAPDRAALLRAGRFGWRVLVVTPEGLAPADEVPAAPPDAGGAERRATELRSRLEARVAQWNAADKLWAARCGTQPRTPVLIAAEAGSRFDTLSLWYGGLVEALEFRLLVSDPDPGAPMAARTASELPFYLTLAGSSNGWAALGSDDTAFTASTHTRASDAAERVVEAGYPEVLIHVDASSGSWSTFTDGLDALAAIGVLPTLGLSFPESEVPPLRAPPRGPTRLTLGEVVPVLQIELPSYVDRSGTRIRRGMLRESSPDTMWRPTP